MFIFQSLQLGTVSNSSRDPGLDTVDTDTQMWLFSDRIVSSIHSKNFIPTLKHSFKEFISNFKRIGNLGPS